jgi:cation diffusion facilitator family transporter
VSIIGKTLLALSQFHFAARCRSQMLRANGQNMCNDIITSAGVLLGLGAARYFRLPALDPAVAMGVSIWVMKNALSLLWHTNQELMDGGSDRKLYKKLFTAVMQVPGVSNPHKARIRKLASRWDIDLDIEVAADMTVHAAHELTDAVEQEIRRAIPDVYDVVIHVEPAGHGGHHRTESYGLNAADIDDDKHPDTASAHKS